MSKKKIMSGMVALLCILFVAAACVDNDGFDDIGPPCFTKESLETVPWIVDELKQHTSPKGGGYYAAVYIYHQEQFLIIMTPWAATPLGRVFNCSGVPLDSLGIDYNDFRNNIKLAAVLKDFKL